MIEKITERDRCFGCTACASVCPVKAISFRTDEKGFFYPEIGDSCVECGSCLKVCPSLDPSVGREALSVAALRNRDAEDLAASSSGGVFPALARSFLESGGAVYGAVYANDFRVEHIGIDDAKELKSLQGSKYAQSDLTGVFEKICSELENKRRVLFSGTSCQCDALVRYLDFAGADKSGLLTVAVLCHGVPSPRIFRDHIAFIEKKRRKKIAGYRNREKIRGWHEHNECVHFADGGVEWRTKLSQNFKDLFYLNVILRESCYTCPYAENPSAADLVIGDYWGMEYLLPAEDDNRGTSICLAITEKGRASLDSVKESFEVFPADRADCLKYNHHSPCVRPKVTDQVWSDYLKYGYEYIVKKYVGYNIPGILKWGIKKQLRRFLVKIRVVKG